MPSASAAGGPRKEVIIAGIAGGALAIGTGVVLAVVSNGYARDADTLATQLRAEGGVNPCIMPSLAERCAAQESSIKDSGVYANASAWSFIVGGLIGAGTLIYVFAAPKNSQVQMAPAVGPGAGGIHVFGTW